MIVFELPQYVFTSIGLKPYSSGLFGCSMGGVGSLNIIMSYPNLFSGAGAFNAPTEANVCIMFGTCHLECLIDPFMCELVWTSPGVAHLAFVVVTMNTALSTTGYYEPFALGIANKMQSAGSGTCNNAGGVVVAAANGRVANLLKSEGYNTVMNFMQTERTAFYVSRFSYLPISTGSSSYYWLDPIWFTIITQGFSPTHNIHTDSPQCEQMGTLLSTMPLKRLYENPGVFEQGSQTLIFCSTDQNDEFNVAVMAQRFIEAANNRAISASLYEDTWGLDGHTMSIRDFKTAFQLFSDLIMIGTSSSRDSVSVLQCPYYLLQNEVAIAQQSVNAMINYAGSKCSVGRDPFPYHLFTDIDAGKNPVDVEAFLSKTAGKSPPSCYTDQLVDT